MPAPVAFNVQQNSQNASASQKVLLYDASGNPIGSTAGALNVSVTNFPATQTVGGTVNAQDYELGSGDVWRKKRAGNLLIGVNQPASGTTIIPAVAGLFLYITGFTIIVGPNCVGAAFSFVTLLWPTTGDPVGESFFAGTSALTSGAYPPVQNFPGFYSVNPTINEGLLLIHNLSAGNFAVQVNYGYTATP